MSRTLTPSLTSPVEVFSDDPEVMALKAMIKGLDHFSSRNLSMCHLRVLLAVELCLKATLGRLDASADQIAAFTGLKVADFDKELEHLVDRRYLHMEIEAFKKDAKPRYKIGSMGGTVLRNMMNRPPKRTRKKQ